MDTDEKVDDFLEHFGVKGMKWGVRKKRDEKARAEKYGKKPMSTEKKLMIAGGIAAGALVAGALIRNNNLRVKDMQKYKPPVFSAEAREQFRQSVARSKSNPLSSLRRTASGAIPMGPGPVRVNGRTLIKDLPKVNGKTQIPPALRSRASAAVAAARNPAMTPKAMGISTLTSEVLSR